MSTAPARPDRRPARARITGLLDDLYDGSDRRRIDSLLSDIERLTAWIGNDWPSWARSLLDLLEAASASSGAGRGSGVSDPTGQTSMRRASLIDRRDTVLNSLDQVVALLAAAQQAMGDVVRTANAGDLEKALRDGRCTGGMGERGAEVWGDPTCTSLAEARRGMCRKHYDLCRAWERDENMRRAEGGQR